MKEEDAWIGIQSARSLVLSREKQTATSSSIEKVSFACCTNLDD